MIAVVFDRSLSPLERAGVLAVFLLTAPLWLTAVVVLVLARLIRTVVLYGLVWVWWIGTGRRRVLLVYSDSPTWKGYVEANILPNLPANAVVLNWSHRKSWNTFSIPVMLFNCFAGDREFNPVGLVFERFTFVELYRFWQPFRDAKHGNPEALQILEARFLRRVVR